MDANWNIFYNGDGVELDKFLVSNQKNLTGYNLFYIVQPQMDKQKNITKFGVALGQGDKSYNRLKQYVITYGRFNRTNTCSGVMLHYLAGTKYNPQVQYNKTKVYQAELILKRYLKKTKTNVIGRGDERTTLAIPKLKNLLENKASEVEDIITELKRSGRLKQLK